MEQSTRHARASRRLPFRVYINAGQLDAILRHQKRGDRRSVADWVEEGLRLALTEPARDAPPAGDVPDPPRPGASKYAALFDALEKSDTDEGTRSAVQTMSKVAARNE